MSLPAGGTTLVPPARQPAGTCGRRGGLGEGTTSHGGVLCPHDAAVVGVTVQAARGSCRSLSSCCERRGERRAAPGRRSESPVPPEKRAPGRGSRTPSLPSVRLRVLPGCGTRQRNRGAWRVFCDLLPQPKAHLAPFWLQDKTKQSNTGKLSPLWPAQSHVTRPQVPTQPHCPWHFWHLPAPCPPTWAQLSDTCPHLAGRTPAQPEASSSETLLCPTLSCVVALT